MIGGAYLALRKVSPKLTPTTPERMHATTAMPRKLSKFVHKLSALGGSPAHTDGMLSICIAGLIPRQSNRRVFT